MFRFSSLKIACSILIVALVWIVCKSNEEDVDYSGWQKAHGNSNGNKYSSLIQIDTGNVMKLQVAWEFHTNDADTANASQIQCNPIIVNGVLFGTTPLK